VYASWWRVAIGRSRWRRTAIAPNLSNEQTIEQTRAKKKDALDRKI
jgi:hypothetical protein